MPADYSVHSPYVRDFWLLIICIHFYYIYAVYDTVMHICYYVVINMLQIYNKLKLHCFLNFRVSANNDTFYIT